MIIPSILNEIKHISDVLNITFDEKELNITIYNTFTEWKNFITSSNINIPNNRYYYINNNNVHVIDYNFLLTTKFYSNLSENDYYHHIIYGIYKYLLISKLNLDINNNSFIYALIYNAITTYNMNEYIHNSNITLDDLLSDTNRKTNKYSYCLSKFIKETYSNEKIKELLVLDTQNENSKNIIENLLNDSYNWFKNQLIEKYDFIEEDDFIIYHTSLSYINDIDTYLKNNIGKIKEFFNISYFSKKIEIKILDKSNFEKTYRNSIPKNSCGNSGNCIVNILEYDEYKKQDGHKNNIFDDYLEMILHELVHVCHSEYQEHTNLKAHWFREALATNLGNPTKKKEIEITISKEELFIPCYNYNLYYSIGKEMLKLFSHEEILNYIKDTNKLINETDIILEKIRNHI